MLQNPIILLPGEKLKWVYTSTKDPKADLKIGNISSDTNSVTIIDVDQKCEHGVYVISILYKENLNIHNDLKKIKEEFSFMQNNNDR